MQIKHGDTRQDGFRFSGYTKSGKEHWLSPTVWAKRYYSTMTFEDKEKAKKKAREYYARNSEKQKLHTKKWREKNPEKVKQQKDAWLQVPINRIKNNLCMRKQYAEENDIEFSIEINDLLPLPQYCPVFGIKLNYQGNKGQKGFVDDSPSIDKIDPKKGYVKGNVQIISWRANRIKSDSTIQELETLVMFLKGNKIADHA